MVGLTSAAAVLLATVAASGFDVVRYRRSLVRELSVAANLVGVNSSAALLFNDVDAASRALAPLRAEPSVIRATLYSGTGDELWTYRRDGGSGGVEPEPLLDPKGHRFSKDRLLLRSPVVLQGEEIGVIWIDAHVHSWLTHLRDYWVVLGPVSLIAILGALLLASRFQRAITGPIFDLASVAHRVSKNGDLTARCSELGADEVGLLATSFNEMLDRIQEQDESTQVHVRALRESEERLRRLSNASREGIVIHDGDLIVDANDAFLRFTGQERSTVLGKNILDFWDSETYPLVEERIRSASDLPYEASIVRRDGTIVPMEIHARPLPFEGRTARVMVLRDLSEVRRTEDALRSSENQLQQAQKMEAVGQLAAGVAHDFNNLLTVIGGNGEMILGCLGDDDPVREQVESICRASASAASLTRQLLAFGRQQVMQPRVLDMAETIRDLKPMLCTILGESVEMTVTEAPGPARVEIDPGQLEQMIVNLVVNAHDAMPSGGQVTIGIKLVTIDEARARETPGVRIGPYVQLLVSDTGVGMDERTRCRLFEPFFTTKGAGKGTGLGLATVYGIVKQSSGYIEAHSTLGQGATFDILLPRVEEPAYVEELAKRGPERLDGTETILLVEDNPDVRALGRRVLHGQGYTVLEASDGEEAVLLSERYGGQINLVLSDVVMPRLSGPHAVERIVEMRPTVQVLYMSGYTDDAIGHHGVLATDVHFIQKPFTSTDLGQKVRDVLELAGRPHHRRSDGAGAQAGTTTTQPLL